MKLYLISQNVNNNYDTYDSAVVAANSEDEARAMYPGGDEYWDKDKEQWYYISGDGARSYSSFTAGSWAPFKDVQAQYIGEAHKTIKAGVVLASFNAG